MIKHQGRLTLVVFGHVKLIGKFLMEDAEPAWRLTTGISLNGADYYLFTAYKQGMDSSIYYFG